MAAAGRVGMGQRVNQNELRTARKRRVEIKFRQRGRFMPALPHTKPLEPAQQCGRLRQGMRGEIAHNRVNPACLCLMRRAQHGAGLTHAVGVAEEDFESAGRAGARPVRVCRRLALSRLRLRLHCIFPLRRINHPRQSLIQL